MTTLLSRALVHSSEAGLVVSELQVRAPRGQEVRVKVRASGVCHSDLHLVDGDWPSDEELVPGHEAAGIVESVGEDVEGLAPGDPVVLSWFPPCGACVACSRGQQWLCSGNTCNDHRLMGGGETAYSLDGREVYPFIGVGALSQYVVVHQAAAVKVTDELPFDIGALIGCSVATGVGAVVNTAEVTAGQAAVVIGCGGVGQATVAGLALVGATPIIAVDLSDERLEQARTVGATHTVNASGDVAGEIAAIASSGVDVVFEAVGHVQTIVQAIELVAPGGAVVLAGLTAVDQPVPLDAYAIAAEGKRILGCNYGSTVAERDFPRLAERYLADELPLGPLVGRHITLDEAIGAFEDMRQARGGRAVVVFE